MDAAFIWNLSKLGRIGSRRLQFDDDFADRLNYQYTSVLLFLFIGLIGVRQYVGKPIQCWIPQEFTRGWEEYAENYCWVANTYFAPIENRLPPVPDRRELLLVYYQWAPIVMAAQALLFYLPCLMWRLGMAHSGFNLHRVLQMAAEANEMLPEATAKTVRILSHYIKSCIQRQRLYKYTNQFKNFGLYNRLVNEAPVDKSHQHFHPHTGQNDEERIPCPTKSEENTLPCMMITKTLNGNSVNAIKMQSEHTLCNQSIDHSISSNSSADTLHKGRGRKAAPPPPPKSTTTLEKSTKRSTIDGYHTGSQPADAKEDMKTSEKVTSSQGSKKKPPCKVSIESRKLGESLKDFGKEHKKFSYLNTFICWCSWCGKEQGNFLVTLYMFVKFSYLSNVIGQIYLMQYFIGTKYTMYGAQVLVDLVKGQEWHHSGHFPRVTFCDLEAKKLGKNHIYTLQCVLPLNMFLEKIYIFLWFWHVLIAFITLISFIVWFYRIYWPTARIKFITDHLKVLNLIPINKDLKTEIRIQEFVNYYLGLDGLFVIRLITANCGILLAGELTAELWQSYQYLCNEQIIPEPNTTTTYICLNKPHINLPGNIHHQTAKDTTPSSMHELLHQWKGLPAPYITYSQLPGAVNPYFWMENLKPNGDEDENTEQQQQQAQETVNQAHQYDFKHSKFPLRTDDHDDHLLGSHSAHFGSQLSTSNKMKQNNMHRSHSRRLGTSTDDIV
uniref:Innexin n=1 Tax=Trichobilharzia regenti TaxID=157069 RepID=A0AA85J3W3_TRIRE|nr:unnamed protein product [Trichobilharzia regenti]